ncbi:RdgB/HAM1 family non-canonical purine NTP pyrophosphatase [Natrialbaceae archaeon A-gly3]
MAIQFVTGNEGKVREAREYFSGIEEVEQVSFDYTEIQSDDLAEIAAHGALEAFEEFGGDGVLVGDTGLFVDALEGFPGPYSAYVEDTVGVERLWGLAREEENRRAHFRTVLAFVDSEVLHTPGRSSGEQRDPRELGVETFTGSVAGTLVAPRGEGGFGYDPIFEYNGQTLAEMSTEEKNAISHRGRALEAFAEWYADR